MDTTLRNWTIAIVVAAIIIIAAAVYFLPKSNRVEGEMSFKQLSDKTGCPAGSNPDDLAKCLKDKGVKFYGAFWCPHCQSEKALFGDAAKDLPYIECSTTDGNGQLQVCSDAGITGYPTWEFPSK